MIRVVLTDIEGTTSSLAFVKEVLFPYARERLTRFIADHAEDTVVARVLTEVEELCGVNMSAEQVGQQLLNWLDEDKKITPLKTLQGLIWESGYRSGELKGHIYPDAARCLKQWRQSGISIYVYSSGSVQAQKLLFSYTDCGDLTVLFDGYFDTTTGPKTEPGSYQRIAEAIQVQPETILFLSDLEAELAAARLAGFVTCQLVRDGAATPSQHPQARTFDQAGELFNIT